MSEKVKRGARQVIVEFANEQEKQSVRNYAAQHGLKSSTALRLLTLWAIRNNIRVDYRARKKVEQCV